MELSELLGGHHLRCSSTQIPESDSADRPDEEEEEEGDLHTLEGRARRREEKSLECACTMMVYVSEEEEVRWPVQSFT